MRAAVHELSWLLSREYAPDSALKLVGDRHELTARQRLAVMRSACSDDDLARRAGARTLAEKVHGARLGVDGYNVLITVEAALSGGAILVGRDGAWRDLASVHGTYRRVEETAPAIELIADRIAALWPERVDWYLDRPVSNSGRLKTLIADLLEARQAAGEQDPPWNIELADSPDRVLADYDGVVATGDSIVLNACTSWFNLAAEVVKGAPVEPWVVDLSA